MKALLILLSFLSFSSSAYSQNAKTKPSDVLFKKRIVRAIDLDNPFNKRIFGEENTLITVLLEAYENGRLVGFQNDQMERILAYEEYYKRKTFEDENGDTVIYSSQNLSQVEVGEYLIFDKHRSEIVFDLETITILIPESISQWKLLEPLVSFSYKDCLKIFKEDERAYSENPLMNGSNIKYAEVFLLKLYTAQIVKIGNNDYFDQMYPDATQAYLARKEAENKLTEYLYKLYNP